jgi:hypothetical protein
MIMSRYAILVTFLISANLQAQAPDNEIWKKANFHIDASSSATVELKDSQVISCRSLNGSGLVRSTSMDSSPKYINENGRRGFRFDGINDFMTAELPENTRLGTVYIFIAGKLNKSEKSQYFVGSKPDARLDIFANSKEFLVELGQEAHTLKHGPLLDENVHIFELSHFLPEKISGQIPPAFYIVDGNICGRPFSKNKDDITKLVTLGAHDNGRSSFLNGDIFEILIFDKPLNANEQNAIRSYLGSKWDVKIETKAAASKAIEFKETRIGPDGKYSSLGIYNESPESPDGKRLVYLVFDKSPSNACPLVPFTIWVCDSNLQNHRMVRRAENTTDNHNAAFQLWIDNDSIAYCSSYIPKNPDGSRRSREIRVFNADTGKLEFGPYTDAFLGDNTAKGKVLMNVDGDRSNLGPRGVYELDTASGKVKCIYKTTDFEWYAKNLNWHEMNKNCARWGVTHARYSPEASRISFMFNGGGSEYLFYTCNADGSDLKYWGIDKPLHELWFDEDSLCGADEITDDKSPDNLCFRRWDRNKRVIETLAGQVNHTAFSPDKQWYAGDSFYRSNPAELYLYKRGQTVPTAVIFKADPQIVWQYTGHINPSFSRDTKRLYYNRPVGNLKQAYYCEVPPVVR